MIFLNNIKLFFCREADKELFYFINIHLGIKARSLTVYREALTHKSALSKDQAGGIICNERLEFLGDSILDSVISDYLFGLYPGEDEGYLTKMRSKIVNRKSLNEMAENLRLERFIISNNLAIKNNNALGNAFEALIGAIYLDKGYDFTKQFVLKKVITPFIDFSFLEKVDTNFKSQLIEMVQKTRSVISFSTCADQHDQQGAAMFTASVLIDGIPLCVGEGYSKKEAEQNASKLALKKLEDQAMLQYSNN